MTGNPTIWWALLAGLLSFASPCTLPLYPSYISYLSGVSLSARQGDIRRTRRTALGHSLIFVLGLSVVFLALALSATTVGLWIREYRGAVRVAGGWFIVAMGLFTLGIIRPSWLMRERGFIRLQRGSTGYFGAFVFGLAFAAGWTPCIGPLLVSVLTLAATNAGSGVMFILFYIAGFAIPFLVLAYSLGSVRWLLRHTAWLNRVGGVLMVVMGLLLATNSLVAITAWFTRVFGTFGSL